MISSQMVAYQVMYWHQGSPKHIKNAESYDWLVMSVSFESDLDDLDYSGHFLCISWVYGSNKKTWDCNIF